MAITSESLTYYGLFSTLTRLETNIWDALDARLRQASGLTLGSFEAMVIIDALGSCRVQDIASALSITVGGTSKLVDRVETSGYCVRKSNPADRRSSLLELTTEGISLLAKGRHVIEGELQQWFGPVLTNAETATLTELLLKVRDGRATHNAKAAD